MSPSQHINALQIEGLTVRHGGVVAVADAALRAAPGAITCLVGMNGAGKSSLLRAIVGLAASEGDISLGTRNLSRLPIEARIHAGIAYVPEGRRVFPGLTVGENLLVAGPSGARLRRQRLDRALDLFPQLRPRIQDRAWQLSGGQQQMLAIGRALMAEPDVYLLDEPTLGLAPQIIDDVAGSLRQLAEEGAAILVAEQNAGFAERVADEIVTIQTGRIMPDRPGRIDT
ncbi:MAG: ATP-binding cassette domain-containing protein [Rhodospirillaceae bacterium]|jgi:branched-chain amino acid transport system ATP-binding protein|nr:ATP-binding cassette domain-containing protein [Rhodospirillaceae bacterium]MBT3930014.1 ATP-binding cassette domain-containing protein [Rhodospirillaceae bacterium]MBT4772704.1 ATP-binding cassette domain-containing protein [Rhodospirillaceae bacterium]MBT5358760.1 ATP-binding cassette domain-containing protein [Rhodospirillaceae bacterium]MBT5770830.1 ATP-binding cassette domain-containing protein [Rhodospirillaceae bacterium]